MGLDWERGRRAGLWSVKKRAQNFVWMLPPGLLGGLIGKGVGHVEVGVALGVGTGLVALLLSGRNLPLFDPELNAPDADSGSSDATGRGRT